MKNNPAKGSALVLALFGILLFMTMVVGFTYDARSQSTYNAGFKLNSYYLLTARSLVTTYGSKNLPFEWVEPKVENGEMGDWRFGPLLQSAGDKGKYGTKVLSEGQVFQNMGNLDLGYNIWVANNQDDPAVTFQGTNEINPTNPTWDSDSKIVVTVEVFDNGDATKTPRATISTMYSAAGYEKSEGYDDAPNVGQTDGPSNQGNDEDLKPKEDLNDYR